MKHKQHKMTVTDVTVPHSINTQFQQIWLITSNAQ